MATLTYLVSIWTGIIIVGLMLFPQHYQETYDSIEAIYQRPIEGSLELIRNAFTGPASGFLLGLLTTGGVVIFLSQYLSGGGFNLLFALPLLIVFAVVQLFVLPTATVLNSDMPLYIKYFYTLIIGGLTILTVITFTSGRN